jgi:hypothetical protein
MIEVVTGVTERRNLRDATSSTGLATFLPSQQMFFPSILYCSHEPNSYALKMEAAFSSKTPQETFHIMGVQTFYDKGPLHRYAGSRAAPGKIPISSTPKNLNHFVFLW